LFHGRGRNREGNKDYRKEGDRKSAPGVLALVKKKGNITGEKMVLGQETGGNSRQIRRKYKKYEGSARKKSLMESIEPDEGET